MASKNGHFEVPRRTLRLVFEDSEYAGAQVVCRLDVPLSLFFELQKAAETENTEEIEQTYRRFGDDVLVEWNLVEEGEPVPATAEGFFRQPLAFTNIIISKWGEAMRASRGPLEAAQPS